jgi:hypothetical protein
MDDLKCCHCGDEYAEYFFKNERESICEMCLKDVLLDEAKSNGDVCMFEDLDDTDSDDLELYEEIKKRSL